jgi:hypothetical protein
LSATLRAFGLAFRKSSHGAAVGVQPYRLGRRLFVRGRASP